MKYAEEIIKEIKNREAIDTDDYLIDDDWEEYIRGKGSMTKADIELVIKLPEETYEYWKNHSHEYALAEAIKNGTPLPKGHGRLIDADGFDAISYQHTSDDFDNGVMWLAEQIDSAPTIIEADKAEGEVEDGND